MIVAKRSVCSVQMGAVLFDKHGIFAWGWNSSGKSGHGCCAERHAISRANPDRLRGSRIAVGGFRKRNDKQVVSFPCEKCLALIRAKKLDLIYYFDKEDWQIELLPCWWRG